MNPYRKQTKKPTIILQNLVNHDNVTYYKSLRGKSKYHHIIYNYFQLNYNTYIIIQ